MLALLKYSALHYVEHNPAVGCRNMFRMLNYGRISISYKDTGTMF